MPLRENRFKQVLKTSGTAFGSSVRLPESGLCEILGLAGFDFVLLDGEHGAMDPSTIDRLTQGCFAGGASPIVRLLRNQDPEAVMQALDLGAQGILIPHCRTAADARALRNAALYPPAGQRGFGSSRGGNWGLIPPREFHSAINPTIVLLALIEDAEGVENIEEIAAEGLDVLWVGTGDLANAYGVPGQVDHPRVLEGAQRVLEACLRHNVAAGFPARSVEDLAWAKKQGYRVIGLGSAEQYVMQTARRYLEAAGRV